MLTANEVDDTRRFSNEKKLFNYIGITPSSFSSGGRTFHGRLSKQGNKYLRWAPVEAIWPAVRSDSELAAYYQRVKAMKSSDPAKTATARLLATIIYQVLKQRGPYYLGKGLGPRPPSLCPGGPR